MWLIMKFIPSNLFFKNYFEDRKRNLVSIWQLTNLLIKISKIILLHEMKKFERKDMQKHFKVTMENYNDHNFQDLF